MKFRELLEIVGEEPVFETGMLLTGLVDPQKIRQQLSRWTRSGRIQQLRRGLYTLENPWRKVHPHPFLIANRLSPGSYVSGLVALAYWHVIPEYVAEVTSYGGGRPQIYQSTLGRFAFRHLKPSLRYGYRFIEVGNKQSAFVAEPEKALLDLVYLAPHGDDAEYLRELRLDYEVLRLDQLSEFAAASDVPKLNRAAERMQREAQEAPIYRVL